MLPTSELTVAYEGVGCSRREEGKRSWMRQSEEGESGLVCRVVNQEDCGGGKKKTQDLENKDDMEELLYDGICKSCKLQTKSCQTFESFLILCQLLQFIYKDC